MKNKILKLSEETLSVIEEIGGHMPGGFFIYKASQPEELIYVNKAVLQIFGCKDITEFREFTGYTFKGMVHPDDYLNISLSIENQINEDDDHMDYAEYRIIRKDGAVRWVDDYCHYAETKTYGGVYVVFISDITEKHQQYELDSAVRTAVISTLTNAYNTVWLISDTEKESCFLYHTNMDSSYAEEMRNALNHNRYSDIKEQYISMMVTEEERERIQEQIGLPYIMKQFETRDQFSVNFIRVQDHVQKHYRVDIGKVHMPGGKTGVMMGFKDVDEEVKQERAMQEALREAKLAEEENRRLTAEVQSAARLADILGSVTTLLSNMPAMSFYKDAKTRVYLACNQAFAEYAGKNTPEEVVGLTDHDLFDRETADRIAEEDTKALSGEGAYVIFEDVEDPSENIVRNMQTTRVKFNDSEGRTCLLGMRVDVTEMTRIKTAEAQAHAKQMELEEKIQLQNQLLKQERHQKELDSMITAMASDYRSVYHVDIDADDAVCYRADPDDPDNTPEGVHFPYLERFSNYCNLYVDDEYKEGFLHFINPDNVRKVLATENIMAFRYLAKRNGKEYYEMLRMAGVRHPNDRDDHIVHAVGVGFTVIDTEMRESMARNHALRDALAAAEDANKAKTAFLSNMSHEIRTPMNAIIGLNNIALTDQTISESTREYLEKIGDSAQHLLGIINDILDMSRIESGRILIKNEEFSFAKALEQVNTMISGQCRDKGLQYECRINGNVEDYYIGDDMKLRQVMINILGNAVKFTPRGGKILFTVEETARFDGKSSLRFVISDTGIGMSKEYLPKLFDPFSQEDSSSTSKYGSTGLGMPITKSIVELMNGSITVESEKGKGTVFTVTVTLGESDRKTAENNDSELNLADLSVLVIDDDRIALEHAEIVLGQIGIRCETAESGWEGIDKVRIRHCRREDYNLILIDWRMPEIDGVETTRMIRSIVGNETPIIILTSFNWDDIAEEAKRAGVDTFVAKPLFAGSVMEEFREAFRRKNELLDKKEADLQGRRILLAEDMAVNAEIMVMVLSMKEIQTDVAENGRIAVEKFSGHEPGYYDAILMDMRMPEMYGLEATRAIRAMDREDAKKIPIIALTANAFDEDVQRSMQAGLNAHLSKPVEAQSLFETLESLIKD